VAFEPVHKDREKEGLPIGGGSRFSPGLLSFTSVALRRRWNKSHGIGGFAHGRYYMMCGWVLATPYERDTAYKVSSNSQAFLSARSQGIYWHAVFHPEGLVSHANSTLPSNHE